MNIFIGFLISASLALVLALTVVLFSRKAMYQLLVELCGNDARARYWALFTGLFLILCTLYGVLVSLPPSDSRFGLDFPGLSAGLSSFRAGVLGLLLAFGCTALVLVIGIRRHEVRSAK